MKVYFISGIGGDSRLFKHIHLPKEFDIHYLDWIKPLQNENIPGYAARLAQRIDKQEPFALVGLSLGGIMAVEIAKVTYPVCTIIIGSIPVSTDLPHYYHIARKLNLQHLIPPVFFKAATSIKHSLLLKDKENRRLMREVIRDGDNEFIRWGMNAVLQWNNETIPNNTVHIHGTHDEVFPAKYTKPNFIINGGHMLVVYHPSPINSIIGQVLLKYNSQGMKFTQAIND